MLILGSVKFDAGREVELAEGTLQTGDCEHSICEFGKPVGGDEGIDCWCCEKTGWACYIAEDKCVKNCI